MKSNIRYHDDMIALQIIVGVSPSSSIICPAVPVPRNITDVFLSEVKARSVAGLIDRTVKCGLNFVCGDRHIWGGETEWDRGCCCRPCRQQQGQVMSGARVCACSRLPPANFALLVSAEERGVRSGGRAYQLCLPVPQEYVKQWQWHKASQKSPPSNVCCILLGSRYKLYNISIKTVIRDVCSGLGSLTYAD